MKILSSSSLTDPWDNQVHQEQLKHVRKGCLERCRQDIFSDGSRIEASHKGWNSLQNAQPSGITVLTALGHDFVLRRNICVTFANHASHGESRPALESSNSEALFLTLTSGSHHVGLIAAIATLHNQILGRTGRTCAGPTPAVASLPELPSVHSNEAFGLTTSNHTTTFGGLLQIKEEVIELDNDGIVLGTRSLNFEQDASADAAIQTSRAAFEELHIDLSLLDQPSGCTGHADHHSKSDSGAVITDKAGSQATSTKRKLVDSDSDDLVSAPIQGRDITRETHGPSLQVSVPPPSPSSKRPRLDLPGPFQLPSNSESTMMDPGTTFSRDVSAAASPSQLNYYFKAVGPGLSSTGTDVPKPKSTTSMMTALPRSSHWHPVPSEHAKLACATSAAVHSLHPVLPHFRADGLTRSQRLFSLATNIDPRSLTIQENVEFYLFMDMRAEFKWISHEMSPKRWVDATAEFNRRLVAKQGPSATIKNPLALLRTLGDLEPRIMNRIIKGDYKCTCTHADLASPPFLTDKSISEAAWEWRGLLAQALHGCQPCQD